MKDINNSVIEDNVTTIIDIITSKFDIKGLREHLIFREIKKCKFVLTENNNKVCNKKIKTDEEHYCQVHKKLSVMISENKNRNNNVLDFNLEPFTHEEHTNLFRDIFDNVFQINNGRGKLAGVVSDDIFIPIN